MSLGLIAFLGIDHDTLLLLTVIVAALWTGLAMIALVFFAWSPYVSDEWRVQFGADAETGRGDDTGAE